MAKTLGEMVAKGQAKLAAKGPTMAANYNAAKSRMSTHFGALPFGPNTKAAYNAAISTATYHAPDAAKWAANWQARVAQ